MSEARKGRGRSAKPVSPAPAATGGAGVIVDDDLNVVRVDAAARDPLDEFFVTDEELSDNQVSGEEAFSAAAARARVMAELLAFWVADEEYAIDIVEIQEIIKVPVITEVPRAPTQFLGIISLRGTIVPVVDLRSLLRLESRPITNASRILVLRGDGEPVGMLVDQVSSVVRLDQETIEPPPKTMERGASEMLRGVGKDGERMLIVLDLTAVLTALETTA